MTLVHAVVHHYADPACSQPVVSISMQGTLQGDRISWSVAAVKLVKHAGGSAELTAAVGQGGLQVLRLYQGRGLDGQHSRLMMGRKEGETLIQEEMVKYKEVGNLNCRLLLNII